MNHLAGSCWDARVRSGQSVQAKATASPEGALQATLTTLEPWLSKAGITRVAVVTGLDLINVPVVMVVRPEGRSLSVAQGKGPSLLQAKVSGIMEALEHFHAESADLTLRYAGRRELADAGIAVVDVGRLPRTDLELLDDTPLLWTAGTSLLNDAEVWVPYELVHLDYRVPLPAGSGYFLGSSTGLGCGTSREDAERSALLEVVERHEMARFDGLSPSAQRMRRLDLASVCDEGCLDLLRRFDEAGVAVSVWDLSSPELAVPCYFCEIVDAERDLLRTLGSGSGFGCHFDPPVALERALCEAAQGRLTAIAGTRDDISIQQLRLARSPASFEEARVRHRESQASSRCDARRSSPSGFEVARSELLDRVSRAGYGPPVVVDLSKPGWPVHAVRVIVPGMLNVAHASAEAAR